MAFTFGTPHTHVGSGTVVVDLRLYLTEDKTRLVREGDPEARWLWCTPGMAVPREDAVRYGLLGEPEQQREDAEPAPVSKGRRRPADKARTPEGDK